MPRPLGTIRNLNTTIAQLQAAGLTYLINELLSKYGTSPQTIIHTFATTTMANRAQRLLYQWLWFHPDIKALVSLRVEGTKLHIKLTGCPEKRGRRGRKDA